MTPTCTNCGARTDAYLCASCTDCRLEPADRCGACMVDILAELPAAIADVKVTAARQSHVGNTPQRLSDEAIAEFEQYDQEERKIPSYLRSKHGKITLVSTPSPVSFDAASLYAQGRNAVITWARHIAETRGVEIPIPQPARRVVDHGTVCTWTWTRSPATIESVCTWLIANVDSIRMDEAAGQMLNGLSSLAAWIARNVDRRPPDVFAGPCTAVDTRVLNVALVGAPCSGLICEHESCEFIRRGRHILVPVIGECGKPLTVPEGETEVECEACGTVYAVAERRGYMADKMTDHLCTVREVVGILRTVTIDIDGETCPLEINIDRVNGWLTRGRIASHGSDANGRTLVLLGEVRDHADSWTRRRAARRKSTAA